MAKTYKLHTVMCVFIGFLPLIIVLYRVYKEFKAFLINLDSLLIVTNMRQHM